MHKETGPVLRVIGQEMLLYFSEKFLQLHESSYTYNEFKFDGYFGSVTPDCRIICQFTIFEVRYSIEKGDKVL